MKQLNQRAVNNVECRKDQILNNLTGWIASELKSLEYGEVGFSLVVHQGKIVRTKRLQEYGYQEAHKR